MPLCSLCRTKFPTERRWAVLNLSPAATSAGLVLNSKVQLTGLPAGRSFGSLVTPVSRLCRWSKSPLWTSHGLSSGFLALEAGVEQRAVFEHGAGDVEETVANGA